MIRGDRTAVACGFADNAARSAKPQATAAPTARSRTSPTSRLDPSTAHAYVLRSEPVNFSRDFCFQSRYNRGHEYFATVGGSFAGAGAQPNRDGDACGGRSGGCRSSGAGDLAGGRDAGSGAVLRVDQGA